MDASKTPRANTRSTHNLSSYHHYPFLLTIADNMDLDASSPGAMLTFYRRLYPFKQIFQWLNHDHVPSDRFTHREFAFTVNDAYIRYNSYSTVEEFKKQVIQLNPSRYEVGAVYTARVSLSHLFEKKTRYLSSKHAAKRQEDRSPGSLSTSPTRTGFRYRYD